RFINVPDGRSQHRRVEKPGGTELVQLRRATDLDPSPAQWKQEVGCSRDLAVEVPGVEWGTPDDLIDLAEIRNGELRRAEGRAKGAVLQFRAGAFQSVLEDLTVIEGERRSVLH